MTLGQLIGKCRRLRTELSASYGTLFWDRRRVARPADDIHTTGATITRAQPADEQSSETLPAWFSLEPHEERLGHPSSLGLRPAEDGTAIARHPMPRDKDQG